MCLIASRQNRRARWSSSEEEEERRGYLLFGEAGIVNSGG